MCNIAIWVTVDTLYGFQSTTSRDWEIAKLQGLNPTISTTPDLASWSVCLPKQIHSGTMFILAILYWVLCLARNYRQSWITPFKMSKLFMLWQSYGILVAGWFFISPNSFHHQYRLQIGSRNSINTLLLLKSNRVGRIESLFPSEKGMTSFLSWVL